MNSTFIRSPHLRQLNPRQDLAQVADLVELCFRDNMDEDGRSYVRQMRRIATEARYLRLPVGRLEGYVFEEGGRIVGNLTLIPHSIEGKPVYLIANVAVEPEFRRQGIGRRLTHAGMTYARQMKASAAWLQVRDDNPGAYDLYRSLGFIERARRTTWLGHRSMHSRKQAHKEGVSITGRRVSDWPMQRAWLCQTYPAAVRWNLPLTPEKLSPDPWNELKRWFAGNPLRHWAARKEHQLIGTATMEASQSFADSVWLAADPNNESLAVRALANHLRRGTLHRPISINYPAGYCNDEFQSAGYELHNTLIWMEAPFN